MNCTDAGCVFVGPVYSITCWDYVGNRLWAVLVLTKINWGLGVLVGSTFSGTGGVKELTGGVKDF